MKILLIDIETAPNVADVWDLWNQNVSLNQLRESSYILCWAAKWYHEDTIQFRSIWGNGGPEDMLRKAYDLLEEADVVVTYNGDRFDLPTLNKEFLLSGFTPPAPYRSVDVFKVVKARFRFPSNKLQYVASTLGVGSKVQHEGHDLWVKVRMGDAKAQERMTEYCKGDVVILEGVYDIVMPWAPSSPNHSLYDGSECPRCDDGELQPRGFAYTATGIFRRFKCKNCGGWSRDTRRNDGSTVATL